MRYSTALARILTAGVLMVLAGPIAAQQAYPNKPVRLIIPQPPGGSSDPPTRLIAQKLAENLGQQVIVENRSGGNTMIGTDAVAKAAPDGYTILLTSSNHVVLPLLFKTPYDVIKDFASVSTLYSIELVLLVHPSLPANTLKELIALAKARPGQLNDGTPGAGTITHLVMELFNTKTGVNIQHVHYKGGGPAITDLMGGQVQMYLSGPNTAIPFIKSGKVKGLAVGGTSRLPAMPQVPTFTEAGLPDFDVKVWYGIIAPAATPKAAVDRLGAEFAKILATPDMKKYLQSQELEPFISGPEKFDALIRADYARFAKIAKAANLKLEY